MSGARLLVADDDASYRAALSAQLRFAGYDVEECADGLEVVERFAEIAPDLLLLDFDMPRLDGLRALQRLRAEPRFEATPILLMSGLDSRTVRVRGLTLGADDFVRKPCDRAELLARIRGALRKRARAQVEPEGAPSLRGKIEEIGLDALLQMLDLGRRSGRLIFEESGGEIVLDEGTLAACRYGRFEGRGALARLLWTARGRFRLEGLDAPVASKPGPRVTLQEALLGALTSLDHARRSLDALGEESWIEAVDATVPAFAARACALLPLRARELAVLMDGPLDDGAAWLAAAFDAGRVRRASA